MIDAARDLGLPEVMQLDAGIAPVSMSEGAQAIRATGNALAGLDALVCVSDPVAFGALMALQNLGVGYPLKSRSPALAPLRSPRSPTQP